MIYQIILNIFIQITATDPSGNQSSAQPVLVTVVNEYIGTINNFTVLETENTLSLNWDAPNDAESFKIYKDGSFLVEISEQTFDDVVDPGVEHCYVVSAVNGVNLEGPLSEEECGTSLYPPSPTLSLAVRWFPCKSFLDICINCRIIQIISG